MVNGQTYTYYVTAVNATGESAPSNEVSATPNGEIPEFSTILPLILIIGAIIMAEFTVRKRKRKRDS